MSSVSSNIMSVGELIDAAFGEPDANIVHHKYIQAVLYLLARQLRILQRRVDVNFGPDLETVPSVMTVTEVKLQAMHTKRKKTTRSKSAESGKSSETEKNDPKKSHKTPTSRKSEVSVDTTMARVKSSITASDNKVKVDKQSARSSSKLTDPSSGKGPQKYAQILNEYEQQREQEIRLIQQRTDSRESRSGITPTPMKSLDSIEAKCEKLLVIERIPIEEAKARAARERSGAQSTRSDTLLPIVTQDEFLKLAYKVQQLQQKLGPNDNMSLEFPENLQLMLDLRKGASLTDAMAALQLSARLEATEKAIEQLVGMVTELAVKSGININVKKDMKVIFEGPAAENSTRAVKFKSNDVFLTPVESSKTSNAQKGTIETKEQFVYTEKEKTDDIVNTGEFVGGIQQMRDEIIKIIRQETARTGVIAENAYKMARNLEIKIDASVNLGDRMKALESSVAAYADRIHVLDTGLSSQISNYQEELTQMQHDLEVGLSNMADALANAGGDATAVAELNTHFNDLQSAIDNAMQRQNELRDIQRDFLVDIDALRIEIEVLRETKADREEVADALRDKAGLGALNGMVSIQHFDAIRGDLEMRILSAYDKFNSQELVWQKVIDDLQQDINDKADLTQVRYLQEDFNQYLNTLTKKLNSLMEIVGEPKAAALIRRIQRNGSCLVCSSPAVMKEDEPDTVPLLPALRPPAVGAEEQTPKEDGDHRKCYPGRPVPHASDPRSHVCHRWCGGSHTTLPRKLSRVPPAMTITTPLRNVTTELGTDGRMYAVDDPINVMPCSQCMTNCEQLLDPNQDSRTHSNQRQSSPADEFSDNMTPPDFCPTFTSMVTTSSMTPSPMFDGH